MNQFFDRYVAPSIHNIRTVTTKCVRGNFSSISDDLSECSILDSVFSSGQESYYYQLIIEKDERWTLPTTQQLLGLSFLQSNIKLAEVGVTKSLAKFDHASSNN